VPLTWPALLKLVTPAAMPGSAISNPARRPSLASLLLHPSRPQEGPFPLFTNRLLGIQDYGRFTGRKKLVLLCQGSPIAPSPPRPLLPPISSTTPARPDARGQPVIPLPQPLSLSLHHPTRAHSVLRRWEHLQIGISFLVLYAYPLHSPSQFFLLQLHGFKAPLANARSTTVTEHPPQSWICPRPSQPCTLRQFQAHGVTGAICLPPNRSSLHTRWAQRTSTFGI
jgi:hypothetical protein